jgi:misacylated tRNA(Ala) deacylase
MAEALYLNNPYLREWEATVTAVSKGTYIVLDKTAFYPNGGGQPWDTGTIEANGAVYNVVYVGKFSGEISHEVDREGLKQGDVVKCSVNWDRRYTLMRMHTAAHVIIQLFNQESGALITGNQLGEDKSRIDLSIETFDREKFTEYEAKINEIIKRNMDVSFKTVPREEALKDPGLFKLAKGFPEEIKEIRIVSIGDYDIQADGGTHVRNTKEIGTVKFVDFVNKGKNNRRIYYTLE